MAPDQNADDLVAEAQRLSTAVDAIQIPDNSHGSPNISGIAAAALLIGNGMNPVVHMNCRDRNRVALQSDLIGAQALGVSNVLLMRGSSFPAEHLPRTSNVFDLGATDFIRIASTIRDSELLAGGQLRGAPKLCIGAAATAFKPVVDWEPKKLDKKVDAGAQFIQLQVCMDVDTIKQYAARLVDAKLTWRVMIVAGLAVFPSADAAREMKKLRPDSIIPPDVIRRLEAADDPQTEGIRICADMLAELADVPGIAGANLMTSGDADSVAAAVHAADIKRG